MALKNNTWKLNQWYDQSVAGNVSYSSTNGALWSWGQNQNGVLGVNSQIRYSSPVQVGSGIDWENLGVDGRRYASSGGIKSDGTMWLWGRNVYGGLGQNNKTYYSSPVQVPGTTWSKLAGNSRTTASIKTDGTLWAWGSNTVGNLGQNQGGGPATYRSSPVQIPGTTWKDISGSYGHFVATKTDGTLWVWGYGNNGQLGQNNKEVNYSSPAQIPGTTWTFATTAENATLAVKTDGTLWSWGKNLYGTLGHNSQQYLSSPVQVGTDTDWDATGKWKMPYSDCETIGVIKNL